MEILEKVLFLFKNISIIYGCGRGDSFRNYLWDYWIIHYILGAQDYIYKTRIQIRKYL